MRPDPRTACLLAPSRATTGSAVLNMARQVGSAIGVALVVVLLGTGPAHTLADFHRVWAAEAGAGILAAVAAASAAARRPVRFPARPAGNRPSG